MNPPENNNEVPGRMHWLLQVIPPLLMLGILFATENGTALVFLTGLLIIPVFISIISIIGKLIFYTKRKYYLIRPCLTVAVFILILAIAQWAYNIALEQATSEARIIHEQCNEYSVCPEHPAGWTVDGSQIRKNDFGFWLKYQASYYYNEQGFDIRVYQGPDLGHNIIGGVNVPFEIIRYQEDT